MRINSLQTRVFAALLLISILPVLVVAFQGYHCGRQAVMDTMYQHVAAVVEARAILATAWLNERAGDMHELAALPPLVAAVRRAATDESADIPALLEEILSSREMASSPYEDFTIYDRSWRPIAGTHFGGHTSESFLEGNFQEAVERDREVHFEAAHPHSGNGVGIYGGIQIDGEQGEPAGFLVANINMAHGLVPLLQNRTGLLQTGKSFIANADLDLITEPFPEGPPVAFRRKANAFLRACAASDQHSVGTFPDYNGDIVVGTARALPFSGWAVAVEIDAAEAMHWTHRLLYRAGLTVLVVLIVAVVLSMWLSKLLGRPLALLARTAHSISSGDTDARLGSLGLGEAEEVRRAFNRMLDELREKERELVRTATLATVGEVTSSVVHELRNPLSSVKMNLQSLAPLTAGSPDNEELAQIAMSQVQRLDTMLNELLQYGRPLALQGAKVTFRQLLEEALELSRDLADQRGVDIDVVEELGDKTLFVDMEQLSRALANLIRNGVEASPEGTAVRVRGHLSVTGLEVTVEDEGAGFRPENLDRLFRPFFTTKQGGTGLGLANVRKVVTLHGGEVIASNRLPKGAVFTMRLPPSVAADRSNAEQGRSSEG